MAPAGSPAEARFCRRASKRLHEVAVSRRAFVACNRQALHSATPGQVLVSMQSMLLGTSDPYFNEPGFETIEGTARGAQQSQAYNRQQRRNTLTHAILGQLERPPSGFEQAVRCVGAPAASRLGITAWQQHRVHFATADCTSS